MCKPRRKKLIVTESPKDYKNCLSAVEFSPLICTPPPESKVWLFGRVVSQLQMQSRHFNKMRQPEILTTNLYPYQYNSPTERYPVTLSFRIQCPLKKFFTFEWRWENIFRLSISVAGIKLSQTPNINSADMLFCFWDADSGGETWKSV